MPIVDDNRLKGNQAAYAVAYWLSRQCLVRPVAEGTDVGIDLFCETIDRQSQLPFLHFWVQVKAGKQVEVTAQNTARCSLKVDHINYWMRQPVPVYVFLVPEDQVQELKTVYVMSFVRKLAKGEVPVEGQGEKTLESDLVYYTSGNLYNLDTFVDTSVRVDYVLLRMFEGVCVPWPQLPADYVVQDVRGFRHHFAGRVAEQVRRSASQTMLDLLGLSELAPEQKRQLAVLANVVRPFVQGDSPDGYWSKHYEDYRAYGQWLRLTGEETKAKEYMTKAIGIILADEQFKHQYPPWKDLVESIEQLRDGHSQD